MAQIVFTQERLSWNWICISDYFVRMAGRAGPRHVGALGRVNNL